ncbi:MAG: hypothetical protein GY754_21970, partial [bacterium]|nr:hypothetical protein [bacterium]
KVNARNKLGRTPLHHVFEVDVARVLLKHGANMHARDNNRYMPIHAVASVREWGDDYNRRDLIKLNYHNYAGKMAKFLIKNGAKINAKAINKRTPLDFAWDAGHSTVTLENRLTGSTRHYNSQKTRVYMILEKSGAKHSREYSEFEKPGDPSPDDFPPEY